jgi:anti-sigma-K factor RskA
MRSHQEIEELLPALALGCLRKGQRREVRRHLRGCPPCRQSHARYEEVAGLLALGSAEAAPPAGLRGKILDGLPPQPSTRASRQGFWTRPRLAPAWAMAGLLLLALLAGANALLWRQLRRQEARSALLASQLVALEATESAPLARGLLVINAGEATATLVVEGLPTLAEDRSYQLWLIRDGQRTSGGLFSVSPGGFGVLTVAAPLSLGSYQAFGITVEPAGGSPGPTGPKVLGGKI